MEKIKLSNNKEYELIVNGVQKNGDNLTLHILAEDPIEDVLAQFSSPDNLSEISVLDSDGNLMQMPFIGYIVLDSLKLQKGYVIQQDNIGTDEDPEYKDITADVYIIELRTEGIREQVESNTAKIDYLLMESGVELDA